MHRIEINGRSFDSILYPNEETVLYRGEEDH